MSIIVYIFLLLTTALFYPLYEDKLSYITLAAVAALPVILLIQLAISAVFLRIKPVKESVTVFKGSEGEVSLKLSNNSVFPLSGAQVRVKIIYRPTGAVSFADAVVPLPALSDSIVTVNIDPKYCGAAEVYTEYVKIYDLLRIFSVKLFRKKGLFGTMFIIPRLTDKYAGYAEDLVNRLRGGASEESSSGQDSGSFGDVSGYRDFAPGDRLSRIHRKLSARFDSDIVRVMSASDSGSFLLWADLSAGDGSDECLEIRDELLEKLMSVAYLLNAAGEGVLAAVPEKAECEQVPVNGGCASPYNGDSDFFAISRVLAGSDYAGLPAALPDPAYVTVKISRDE